MVIAVLLLVVLVFSSLSTIWSAKATATTPCGWAEWNEWVGRCNVSVCGWCDKHTRTRICKAGCDCEGASSETESCGNRNLCVFPTPTCCIPHRRSIVDGRVMCGSNSSIPTAPIAADSSKNKVIPANLTRECMPCGDFRVEFIDGIGPELKCSTYAHPYYTSVTTTSAYCDHEHLVTFRDVNLTARKVLQCTSTSKTWSAIPKSTIVPANPIITCVLIGNGKKIYDIP